LTDACIARAGSRKRLFIVGGLFAAILLAAGSTRLADGVMHAGALGVASAPDEIVSIVPSSPNGVRRVAYRLFAERKAPEDVPAGRRLVMSSICRTTQDAFARRLVVCSVRAPTSWREGMLKVSPVGRIR
jgi:hypothetical protein